jgi:hypothetical protein
VNISQRRVAIFIDEIGRSVLGLTDIHLAETASLLVYVQDTDDIGIWGSH